MKKIKVLLPIIILIIIFVFLFKGDKEEAINLGQNYNFEDPKNYLFYQEDDKTIIQNKNLDFSFKMPGSWTIEGFKDDFASGLNLLSPDYKEDESFLLENGCKLVITVYEEKDEYLYTENIINHYKNNDVIRENTKIIEIDKVSGYMTGGEENSYYKSLKIPLDNRIYFFEGVFSNNSREFCEESYNDLLNSISFSKNEE